MTAPPPADSHREAAPQSDSVSQRGVSPKALLAVALGLGLAFALAHLVGLRDNISILSGTVPVTAGSYGLSVLLGLLYLGLYASAVLVVPTLVLAAGLLTAHAALKR